MATESPIRLVEEVVNKCVERYIPYSVMFELTYRCNLNCRHCFIVKDGNINELSTEEVKNIIDQLVEIGTFFLAFTGGEIFMRDDLFEIAWHAKRKGFLLTFMTNGTLITPEKVEEIRKMKPVKFEFSLYGATAKTHDYITRVKGSFERTVEAIKRLVECGIDVTIKTVLMNLNVKEREEMEALAEELGAHPRINPGLAPRRDGSLEPLKYDLSFEEMMEYLPEDYDEVMLSYLSEKSKDISDRFICKAGKAGCCISPDGTVYPCVMMPIPVGNLREKSFKEIWHTQPSKELKRLRNLTAHDLTTCPSCDLAPFCIRCPGVVYLETGDIVGASPSACKYARWRKYVRTHHGNTATSIGGLYYEKTKGR